LKKVEYYIFTLLIGVFFTAFTSSFLSEASQIVSSDYNNKTTVEVLKSYFEMSSNIPYSNSGNVYKEITHIYEVNKHNFKNYYFLQKQFHSQLFQNKIQISSLLFSDSLAQQKMAGFYLLSLRKLLI
jgi:hypothetical protein